MKTTMAVSDRGQITLPKYFRQRLGVLKGGWVTVREKEGRLEIAPAAVMEIETYTDAQIKGWDKEDALAKGEKEKIAAKLRKAER